MLTRKMHLATGGRGFSTRTLTIFISSGMSKMIMARPFPSHGFYVKQEKRSKIPPKNVAIKYKIPTAHYSKFQARFYMCIYKKMFLKHNKY